MPNHPAVQHTLSTSHAEHPVSEQKDNIRSLPDIQLAGALGASSHMSRELLPNVLFDIFLCLGGGLRLSPLDLQVGVLTIFYIIMAVDSIFCSFFFNPQPLSVSNVILQPSSELMSLWSF